MKWSYLFAVVGLSALLAGCGPKIVKPDQLVHMSVPAYHQHQKNSQGHYVKVSSAAQAAKRIETQYVPVPVPGQLMAAPTVEQHVVQKYATPEEAIAHANQVATVEPKADNFFNAVATYHWMPGAMYTIYTAPMQVTDIEFQPGEKIISYASGDTVRWQVLETRSGNSAGSREHLLIKPVDPNLTNTLLVTTNKRTYHLILKSTDNGTFMVGVKWQYPSSNSMLTFAKDDAPTMSTSSSDQSSSGPYACNPMEINNHYKILYNKKPNWLPKRVFSCGHQTYIQLPNDRGNDVTLPILEVLQSGSSDQYTSMINTETKGPFIVMNSILNTKARLVSGIKKQGRIVVYIEPTS